MPRESPGWPILKAKSGPKGPSICIDAANPTVSADLIAVLAASMILLRLGTNSRARNVKNFSGAWNTESIKAVSLSAVFSFLQEFVYIQPLFLPCQNDWPD